MPAAEQTMIMTMSAWLVGANVFFFLAACARDLLILRCCLLGAYVCLFLNNVLGLPQQGEFYRDSGIISADGVVWCVVIAGIHSYAVWRLCRDEGPVELSPDFEPIWRLFYRRSGIHRLEFHRIAQFTHIEHFNAGDVIANTEVHKTDVFFLLEGVVTNQCVMPVPVGSKSSSTRGSNRRPSSPSASAADSVRSSTINTIVTERFSASFLAVHLFGVLGINVGPLSFLDFTSVAKTKCRVLVLPLEALQSMATSPPLLNAWKNLLLYQLAACSGANISQDGVYFASSGQPEDDSFYDGGLSADFAEFSEAELDIMRSAHHEAGGEGAEGDRGWLWACPHWLVYLCSRLRSFAGHFSPLLSSGLRHQTPTPLHGIAVKRGIINTGTMVRAASPSLTSPTPRAAQPYSYSYDAVSSVPPRNRAGAGSGSIAAGAQADENL